MQIVAAFVAQSSIVQFLFWAFEGTVTKNKAKQAITEEQACQLGKDYRCPVCQAPKRRFKAQKPASGGASSRRGTVQPASGDGVEKGDTPVLLAGGVGILVVVAAVYFYLNSQF
ncbi:g7694 [Coccomyxa elongata]